jgi:hypothetical protein
MSARGAAGSAVERGNGGPGAGPESSSIAPRGNFLSHGVFDTCEAILGVCCDAGNAPIAKSGVISSIGTREWAQVKIAGGWSKP